MFLHPRIAIQKPKETFFAAVSIPCFEYWLLLHFEYTTKPFAKTATSSVGEQVLRDLKRFIPDYEKGCEKVFSSLYEQLEFAKSNAERALVCASKNHTDNPSTNIHTLVHFLQNLRE